MRLILMLAAGFALLGCERPVATESAEPSNSAAPSAKPERAIMASFDCDRARGQAQELICGDSMLAAMDRELARLTSLAGDPASQAEWVQQRDACAKADELRQCVMAAAMLKIHRVRQGSEAARAAAGPSLGPVEFDCRGLPDPLQATFVQSDPGAVTLEWGGRSIAIEQISAASSAYYEGRWDGQSFAFRNKDREATFTMPGKGDLQCSETPPAP